MSGNHVKQINFLKGNSRSAAALEDEEGRPRSMSKKSPSTATPMMKQYHAIKTRYADCLLFFHLGDFYEMFYDDAVTASRVLGLTLTSRDKNAENPVPLVMTTV